MGWSFGVGPEGEKLCSWRVIRYWSLSAKSLWISVDTVIFEVETKRVLGGLGGGCA